MQFDQTPLLKSPLISRLATASATLTLMTCLAVGSAQAADQGPRKHARGEYDGATATYVVAAGDDLSVIGERFGVPLQTLKTENKLESDVIQPGDRLVLAAAGTPEANTDADLDTSSDAAPDTNPQMSTTTVQSLSAPDSIETRIGTLEFSDGVPSAETARTVYDTLDFTRALNVYNNSRNLVLPSRVPTITEV